MIKPNYFKNISTRLQQFARGKKVKIFIFGSSLKKNHFGDVDIGILGDIKKNEIQRLQESFEDSNLPYLIDIVDFNTVAPVFKNNVLKEKIQWIKR